MNAHDAPNRTDTQSHLGVVGNPRTPPAIMVTSTNNSSLAECTLAHDVPSVFDAHLGNGVGGPLRTPPPAVRHSTPTLGTRVAEYELRNRHITFLAETLNDLEDL